MGIKSKLGNFYTKFKEGNRFLNTRNCLKGSILVLLGILNTRSGIGIGRLSGNLGFGFFTYFLLIFSAMMVVNMAKVSENQFPAGILKKKIIWSLLGIFYAASVVLSIIHVMLYFLDSWIIVYVLCFGIIWILLGLYAMKRKSSFFIRSIIICSTFALGLYYGAVLNILLVTMNIYFFVITTFFLQLSREITKKIQSLTISENPEMNADLPLGNLRKTSKFLIIFQLIAMIFYILPILTPLLDTYLFFYALVINGILIVISVILTLKQLRNQRISKKLNTMLKIEIFILFVALLLASI